MSPITIGVFVTFGFVLLGVLGKAIAHGWKWDDVYLGMEMALTTISWSVIYAFDLSRQLRMEAGVANNSADIKNLSNLLQWNTAFLVAALICYFLIAHIHRWWERHPTKQYRHLMLAGIGNMIGAGLLVTFILYVKGGY